MNRNFITDFMRCGASGWCMECMWTGIDSIFFQKDKQLACRTSVWMFPIYGLAACFSPMCKKLEKHNSFLRGTIYMLCIYAAEYTTGSILKKWDACPWDYSKSKWNYRGLIRFDYAPAWFCAGLFYEKLLEQK